MLVVIKMFLVPISDGLMRTLETVGVDGVAVVVKRTVTVKLHMLN